MRPKYPSPAETPEGRAEAGGEGGGRRSPADGARRARTTPGMPADPHAPARKPPASEPGPRFARGRLNEGGKGMIHW
ncbi:hypothetical protein GCM10017673_28270 [Streptosporangium violaceochromogenes]|nr:hypothetical protein GCM10017673_28270 [Streptosporangium violaceochromogenes]